MNQQSIRAARIPGLALGVALAGGAVGAATMASMPTANATCASFFGIGNSANCTSSLTTIAIAIGADAQAHAGGLLGAALSLGDGTSATTEGWLNVAVTQGTNSSTTAGGLWSAALAVDADNTTVSAGAGPLSSNNWWNIATSFGSKFVDDTSVTVNGIGNLGVHFLAQGNSTANGMGTVTVNVLGANNTLTNTGSLSNVTSFISANTTVAANGTLNWAFDVDGISNTVQANNGGAVAGALFQENETVTQTGPGVNVRVRPTTGSSARPNGAPAVSAAAATGPSESATAPTGKKSGAAKARNRR